MTRWHTDAPVQPVARVRSLRSSLAVDMFRSDGAAVESLRIARAYWNRKLRQRAKDQAASRPGSET